MRSGGGMGTNVAVADRKEAMIFPNAPVIPIKTDGYECPLCHLTFSGLRAQERCTDHIRSEHFPEQGAQYPINWDGNQMKETT
jgi:hypothetical protein